VSLGENVSKCFLRGLPGKLNDTNDAADNIIKRLKQEYETDKIYTHIDTTAKEIWLNLDW